MLQNTRDVWAIIVIIYKFFKLDVLSMNLSLKLLARLCREHFLPVV